MTDYQAGIPQALTLMHGGLIHNATDLGRSGLLKSLAAPFFTDEQRLDTLFLSTLSRYPEPAERDVMLQAIALRQERTERQQVLGDVLWALLEQCGVYVLTIRRVTHDTLESDRSASCCKRWRVVRAV